MPTMLFQSSQTVKTMILSQINGNSLNILFSFLVQFRPANLASSVDPHET
jgi:hypothetical protein